MNRVIHPPRAQHARLRQKLTEGEQTVLNFFDSTLPSGWEIYVQPHLNGLRPDFVLLNPAVGIAVFEVKDWNLNAMRYFIKESPWGPSLWAEKDGETFCIDDQNPVTKVNLYKREIFDLYCPRLGDHLASGSTNAWAAISAGIIFPFADSSRVVEALLQPFLQSGDDGQKYQPVSGRAEIAERDIRRVFPESRRARSWLMNDALADDLRGWLVEPDFAATQRLPLEMDAEQRALAASRTASGFRRVKGPAGSGKSLVLAARAAALMNEGKSVLVATYNITLWHYLRDLMVRGLDRHGKRGNVRLTHFHLWCKHVCVEAGWSGRYDTLVKCANESGRVETLLSEQLPALAAEAALKHSVTKYDAILVDEGQDYRPNWWSALRRVRNEGGEMLLVADATQDVYGTATAWTDDVMLDAGFTGRWAKLNVSYRLPPVALDMARQFAERFLPPGTVDLPQQDQESLDIFPCTLRWLQISPESAVRSCVDETLSLMKLTGENGLANADITFLTESIKLGQDVENELKDRNIKAVTTFAGTKEEQRRKKMGFFMGDARIKATTLHSFKGWEGRLLAVYIANGTDAQSLALIYAGLTRLKRSTEGSWLTVVCSAPDLAEFGREWEQFEDRTTSFETSGD